MRRKRCFMNSLEQQWLAAKQRETDAQEERRRIEDEIIRTGAKCESLRISQKMNRKVDSGVLQRVARESGNFDALNILFRWKPEINAKEWEKAPESVRLALAPAITDEPARPSFTAKESK